MRPISEVQQLGRKRLRVFPVIDFACAANPRYGDQRGELHSPLWKLHRSLTSPQAAKISFFKTIEAPDLSSQYKNNLFTCRQISIKTIQLLLALSHEAN